MNMHVSTYVIRAVKETDLVGMYELAVISGDGFTSLQADLEFLKKYIHTSIESFISPRREKPHKFLLVLEHIPSGKIVGCAAVKTNIGVQSPFINFQMKARNGELVTQISKAHTLCPSSAFDGMTEVGSLFLHPEHRGGGTGRYLASARYQLIATAPDIFGEKIVAELRGMLDDENECQLYNSVFKEKLGYTFSQADQHLAALDKKLLQHIQTTPDIILGTLPDIVTQTLAHPHTSGIGAYKLLRQEGFEDTGSIDLFDGGPIVCVHTKDLRILKDSHTLCVIQPHCENLCDIGLINTRTTSSFRAILSPYKRVKTTVFLPPSSLEALRIHSGESVTLWHQRRIPPSHNTYPSTTSK